MYVYVFPPLQPRMCVCVVFIMLSWVYMPVFSLLLCVYMCVCVADLNFCTLLPVLLLLVFFYALPFFLFLICLFCFALLLGLVETYLRAVFLYKNTYTRPCNFMYVFKVCALHSISLCMQSVL